MPAPGGSDALILLLVGGGLALGLPHITARDRQRFWHPWINSGLLPLLLGMAVGPACPWSGGGWLSVATAETLQPFLAVVLTAAGVLVGTQVRPAHLVAAGLPFIRRHSVAALGTFVLAAIPGIGLGLLLSAGWAAIAVGGLTGALAVASSQRPPLASGTASRHAVVMGQVVPAGWWNLIALSGGALALGIGDRPHQGWASLLLSVALPAALGLVLGRTAAGARSRAEAFLFLPAVLALAGGLALVLGSAPLFTGLVVGCVLANAGRGRAALVERSIDELEQPVALATGLLAGLCLEPQHVGVGWEWLVLLLIPMRWILRGWWSPTAPELAAIGDRRRAPASAAGVLLIAGASLAPHPLPGLVVPLTLALTVGTLLADLYERRR